MNTFFLNPNLIECVNITYQAVCPEYVWYDAFPIVNKTFLGSKKIKTKGFYKNGKFISQYEIINDNKIILDNKVYTKTNAYVYYNHGGKCIYFDSDSELEAFIEKIEKVGIFIKVNQK
jgi:hypothetical protein